MYEEYITKEEATENAKLYKTRAIKWIDYITATYDNDKAYEKKSSALLKHINQKQMNLRVLIKLVESYVTHVLQMKLNDSNVRGACYELIMLSNSLPYKHNSIYKVQ